ncbi:MAG: Maf family nucleotide pyrophosphatase [Pseudomonadota bacterium]
MIIKLILASSSTYRKALMTRLNVEFSTISPDIDESEINGENAREMAIRLAFDKASVIANQSANSIIIGADQTVNCDGRILGKPGNFEIAKTQLRNMSGKEVIFYTSLCVINTETKLCQQELEQYIVSFRELDADEISRYLHADKPFNCAGSFKSESLGISLLDKMKGDDPTALVGLPLIKLSKMLRNTGLIIP